jgi:hypothetical protein
MTVNIRYFVYTPDEAITFYTEHLGFQVEMQPGPGFARLARGTCAFSFQLWVGQVARPSACRMEGSLHLEAGIASTSKSKILPVWSKRCV